MKFKIIFAVLFSGFILNHSFGQTANDFKNKYGSETYYEIRPKILMSAEFDKNGQVCRVSFQPNHISKKTGTNYLGQNVLDLFELEEAFAEIVPLEQRKGEIKSDGFIASFGMFIGSFDYETIGVGLKGSLRSGEKSRRLNLCGISGESGKQSLFCSPFGTPEIVTVVWTKRTCAEN
jgi:hypothetical protein